MPEKGWKIVTVREETKRRLIRLSKARGMSINDLIVIGLPWEKGCSIIPTDKRKTEYGV